MDSLQVLLSTGFMLTGCRYHWHTKILDPEHTKVVFYEDLQDNPTEEVASMAAFMGLDFSESDISQVSTVFAVDANTVTPQRS